MAIMSHQSNTTRRSFLRRTSTLNALLIGSLSTPRTARATSPAGAARDSTTAPDDWTREIISNPEPNSEDDFGKAVALSADGSTALIGATHETVDGHDLAGTAYVFSRTSSGWDMDNPTELPNPDPDGSEQFGDSVALSADGLTAVIGVPQENATVGAAYVFRHNSSSWDTENPVLLRAPEPRSSDYFGTAVALSGEGSTALIGAPHSDATSPGAGAVYIFNHTTDGWDTENPLLLSEPNIEKYDNFGTAIALSGDGATALIGAPGTRANVASDLSVKRNNVGTAYVFKQLGGEWAANDPIELPNPDPDGLEQFGYSVALSEDGSTALIDSQDGEYVFRQTSDEWDADNSSALPGEYYKDVALNKDGSTALIGGRFSTGNGEFIWRMDLYTRTTDGWQVKSPTTFSLPNEDIGRYSALFPVALSDNGSTILAGASHHDSRVGRVYSFIHQQLLFPEPLLPGAEPPQDLDGDGFYEDINGDGTIDLDDVFAFNAVVRRHKREVLSLSPEQIEALDFNDDDKLTNADVMGVVRDLVDQFRKAQQYPRKEG